MPMTYHENMNETPLLAVSIRLGLFPMPLALGFEEVPRVSLVQEEKTHRDFGK